MYKVVIYCTTYLQIKARGIAKKMLSFLLVVFFFEELLPTYNKFVSNYSWG